jgi:integrase
VTSEALALLGEPGSPDAKVFPLLGVNAMANELHRIRSGVTVHGMRSSFRDWAGGRPGHEPEIAEAALAHAVGDKTERAYRRGDGLEKRRALMTDWATHLASQPAEVVVPLRRAS